MPAFITAPGDTDVFMWAVGIFLLVAILAFGNIYLHLHTLPERMAHRGHKLQFEIVAVLGLISLFTHNHIFWIIGLLLAFIDLPDFSGYFGRIAGSVEKIAGVPPGQGDAGVKHGIGDEMVPAGSIAGAEASPHALPPEIELDRGDTVPTAPKRPELAATGTRG